MTQTNTPHIAVLIVAGGNGSRMGHDTPKQYLPIHGQMTLRHTIDLFDKMEQITTIQCVIGAGQETLYQQAVTGINPQPYVIGGTSRQQSVFNGLKALESHNPDYILIHDAARPCVTEKDIHNIINNLKHFDAVTLAQPVTETLHRNGDIITRENAWIIQTPQAFQFSTIIQAHEALKGQNHTDDTAIYMEHTGEKIHYIPCGRHNLKITTQDDLEMAEKLLSPPLMETRTGLGFDVHAFDTASASSIRLCGIDIPHDKTLKGHSDADVGLHTITDAILGAMAEGDIGTHFPPSNNDFKNMDSHIFLDKSVGILKSKNGKIIHIDVTFMCEEPKIGKHNKAIRDHLSNHLNLSTSRISIKATTTEKLGFTGRGEGIACQAVVTIQVPTDD